MAFRSPSKRVNRRCKSSSCSSGPLGHHRKELIDAYSPLLGPQTHGVLGLVHDGTPQALLNKSPFQLEAPGQERRRPEQLTLRAQRPHVIKSKSLQKPLGNDPVASVARKIVDQSPSCLAPSISINMGPNLGTCPGHEKGSLPGLLKGQGEGHTSLTVQNSIGSDLVYRHLSWQSICPPIKP